MLKKKQIFKFGDVSFMVDPKKPHIVMTVGKEKYSIKKNEIWSMAYMMSKEKEQADLIPVQKKEMVEFWKQVEIRATKDIKAGETIKTHIRISIPVEMANAELTKDEKDTISHAAGVIPTPTGDSVKTGI